jgi:hypothetical protein
MKYTIKGEWDTEPDQCTWIDSATGYVCEVRRDKEKGYWGGCIRLPQDHALSLNYEIIYETRFEELRLISSYLDSVSYYMSESDNHIWIGFDYHSTDDILPCGEDRFNLCSKMGATYKNLQYVKDTCALLAKQLKYVHLDKYFEIKRAMAHLPLKLQEELDNIDQKSSEIGWKRGKQNES